MDAAAPGEPLISVVVPTHRRPALLPRAVRSVLAQTFADWELIISDDEREENPSRAYAREVAASDARVRLVMNTGERGQAGNVNNAMSAARGAWIKPLFDDDELFPECLERMLEGVRLRPEAAMACCLTEMHVEGGLVKRKRTGARRSVEAITGQNAILAQFLQDVEIGAPTQVLVRRDVVQRHGAWFPTHPRIVSAVDELWYTLILKHGDLVIVTGVLTAHYQTGHSTITSELSPRAFDDEKLLLKEMQYPILSATSGVPSLASAQRAMLIERALWRLTHGHVGDGLKMLLRPHHPRAMMLAARWVMRRVMPGRFEGVPRVIIELPGANGAQRSEPGRAGGTPVPGSVRRP